jgi:hypothetical protein
MSLARRLERLRPALSAKELFLIALEQYKNGPRVDVDLGGLTPTQHREYMDYARLVVGFNLTAGTFLPLIGWRAECLNHDLDRAAVIAEAAQQMQEKEGTRARVPPGNWRQLTSDISVQDFLRGLEREQRDLMREQADSLWLELDAMRQLRDEATDLLGEDPAQPATAEAGEQARAAVESLRQRLGLKRRPLPNPAVVRQYREYLQAVAGTGDLELPR